MDLIIRVIVMGLIPVIVVFILTLKMPGSKDNRIQNEIILEYNIVFKLIFWICLLEFMLMLIFFVYKTPSEEIDSIYILIILNF